MVYKPIKSVLEVGRTLRNSFNWWMTNSVICYCPSKKIRRGWLKHLGMKINGNVMFYEDYHIRNPKGIIIEDGVSIGPKVLLDGRKGLHIGKSAVIA